MTSYIGLLICDIILSLLYDNMKRKIESCTWFSFVCVSILLPIDESHNHTRDPIKSIPGRSLSLTILYCPPNRNVSTVTLLMFIRGYITLVWIATMLPCPPINPSGKNDQRIDESSVRSSAFLAQRGIHLDCCYHFD